VLTTAATSIYERYVNVDGGDDDGVVADEDDDGCLDEVWC